MISESVQNSEPHPHRLRPEPLAWRRLSQPASDAVHAIATALQEMSITELGNLLEESLVLNVTNCWWAEFRAAPFVRALVAEELGRRSMSSQGLRLTRNLNTTSYPAETR